jgi:hypothetical protein
MWREIWRRAASLETPHSRAPRHAADPDLIVLRVAMIAAREGWCPDFTRAYCLLRFLDDRPTGLDGNMRRLLFGLGRKPEEVLTMADETEFSGSARCERAACAAARALRIAALCRPGRGVFGQ